MRNVYFLNIVSQFFSLVSPMSIFSFIKFYRLRKMISALSRERTSNKCAADDKKHVLFLMNPWCGANVPFYQFYLAKLSTISSMRIIFFHDSYALFPNMFSFFYKVLFRDAFGRNSSTNSQLTFGEKRDILHIVRANIIWQSRSEFFLNLVPRQFIRWLFRRQQNHFISVRQQLSQDLEVIDKMIIPGGVYSVSASYVLAAKQLGILFYTYDSGADGELIFCRNGIASHMDDIDDLKLEDLPTKLIESLELQGVELMNNRALGTDKFKYQKVVEGAVQADLFPKNKPKQLKILVPLSCPWDAASLCRKDLFQSEVSFLSNVLKSYPDDQVIIRVHPVERYDYGKRNDKISEFLKTFRNCYFIAADADVNTYSLLKEVDLVICRNTTLGLEANILGIPVISTTRSYWNPSYTLENVTLDKSEALLLYAVAQEHSWLFPTCNLQNVFGVLVQESTLPMFPEFISLITHNSTVTTQKLAL